MAQMTTSNNNQTPNYNKNKKSSSSRSNSNNNNNNNNNNSNSNNNNKINDNTRPTATTVTTPKNTKSNTNTKTGTSTNTNTSTNTSTSSTRKKDVTINNNTKQQNPQHQRPLAKKMSSPSSSSSSSSTSTAATMMFAKTALKQSIITILILGLIAIGILLYPQPPITNVIDEIALPLANQYIQEMNSRIMMIQNQNEQQQQNHQQQNQHPLQGLNIVITGPTSGIGKGLATILHQLGANVIGIGRSKEKLQEMMILKDQDDKDDETCPTTTTATSKSKSYPNRVLSDYVVADFTDLKQVSNAANELLQRYNGNNDNNDNDNNGNKKNQQIDMIIANAGAHYHWTTFGSPSTKQGLDLVFGVNYMAHFLLIEKLVPSLIQSKYAKLLYVNSFFHYAVDGSDLYGTITFQKDNNNNNPNNNNNNNNNDNDNPNQQQSQQQTYSPSFFVQPPDWIYATNYTKSCPHTWMIRDQYMYGSSKFAMMLHAESIHSRYNNNNNNNNKNNNHSQLHVVSADPGWTATNLNGNKGSLLHDPLQWIGFPVMGWGVSSILHALFSIPPLPLSSPSSSSTTTTTTSAPTSSKSSMLAQYQQRILQNNNLSVQSTSSLSSPSSTVSSPSTTYWSNARNYFILPHLFNGNGNNNANNNKNNNNYYFWTNYKYAPLKFYLRDWIIVVQGFALGFLQRFHYQAFRMPFAKEIHNRQLQSNVYEWSLHFVQEYL